MTELRETVEGATIFNKLDLKDSYHMIQIKKGVNGKPLFAPDMDIKNTK